MKAIIFSLLFLIFCSSQSYAFEAFYGGGMLGLSDPSADGAEMEISFGLRGGIHWDDNISMGIYLQRYSTETRISDLTLTTTLVDLRYALNSFRHGTYVGANVGFTQSKIETSITNSSLDDSFTTFGILGGYNFELMKNLTLAPEIDFLFVQGDPDNYSIMNIWAVLTYHIANY